MRKLVYIACPYTVGDVAVNVKNASRVFEYLANNGVMPFNPLLSHFQHMMHPRSYDWWLEWDLEFLPKCDAVVRIEGISKGADKETAYAEKIGIPVHRFEGFNSEALTALDKFIEQLKATE
jgi:hypothetical protein